jgi:putative transcriptional regulator
MKKRLFEELLQSVQEMKAIRGGRMKPTRTFSTKGSEDVAAVRRKLNLSQQKFAQLLGISENTLQNWEQGRRRPSGAARVLLRVAARHPEVILEAA